MKVLLPIDMTHPVSTAIDQISRVLPLEGRTVHLLYVNEIWPAYENLLGAQGEFADDWGRIVNEHALKTMDEAEKILQSKCLKVTREIVSGPPALMIETVARDEHFDVTVMTPGKHPMFEKILLGTVSEKVLMHGPGAILIVHPLANYPSELRTVLIGVDGSRNATEAMLKSVDLFQLNKREVNVVLLHAVDVADPIKYISPVEFVSRLEQNLVLEGDAHLAEAKKLLVEAGVKRVDFVLKQGKPAHEIIQAARALPADLIIAGAEGHTAMQHILLGSVSQRIAMEAPCAVAIFKKDYRPASS